MTVASRPKDRLWAKAEYVTLSRFQKFTNECFRIHSRGENRSSSEWI